MRYYLWNPASTIFFSEHQKSVCFVLFFLSFQEQLQLVLLHKQDLSAWLSLLTADEIFEHVFTNCQAVCLCGLN